jgi:uncharacterized membrane protein YsdA (DUF1294 family)
MKQSFQRGQKSSHRTAPKRQPKQTFSIIAIALVVVLGIVIYFTTHWHLYWTWLVTLSLITFVMYGFDKGQSKRDGLRVPEIVLHGLALFGGFPGGWLGRWLFRHKTQKVIFLIVLVVSTLLHIGVIYYLFFA